MEISEKIKNRRIDLGLTQTEVAEKLFVTRQSVSNWELGKSYPNIDSLVAISDLYDLSLDYLFKEDKEMVKKLTHDVTRGRRSRIFLILMSVMVLLSFVYFIGYHLNYGSLYNNVKQWNSKGESYSLVEDDINYQVVKIHNNNVITLPESLSISATDFSNSSGNQISIDYSGNDKAFVVSWLSGPLMGHSYTFDQDYKFKNSLQGIENQEESIVIRKIIEETIANDHKKVRKVFGKVKTKWNEVNA